MNPLYSPANFTVDHGKLVTYLLNEQHPAGGPKAGFFRRHGFDDSNVETLAMALARHALAHSPGVERVTPKGFVNIAYTGPLEAPSGARPKVRTVWVVGPPDQATFVTAYPCR